MTSEESNLMFTRTNALTDFLMQYGSYLPSAWQIEKECQSVVIHTYGLEDNALEEAKKINDFLEENSIHVNAYGIDNWGKIFFDIALDDERSSYFIQHEHEQEINCLQDFLAAVQLPDGYYFNVSCSDELTLQIQILNEEDIYHPIEIEPFWKICKEIMTAGFIIVKAENNLIWQAEIYVTTISPYFSNARKTKSMETVLTEEASDE